MTDAAPVDNYIKNAFKTPEQMLKSYVSWAETYDESCKNANYQGPMFVAQAVYKYLGENKNGKVMDVAAGTGLVAMHLHKMGASNLDALDASPEMMEIAEERKLYKKTFLSYMSEKPVEGIEKDTYDVTAVCGGFAENHLPVSSMKEMIRITKKGGYIILSLRKHYLKDIPQYYDFNKVIAGHVTEGLWEEVERYTLEKYMDGRAGLFVICQVL